MNANARYVLYDVLPNAGKLLPVQMSSVPAWAMLMAIGFQESDGFNVRRQYGPGPARGWWQFEEGGVRGVIQHEDTKIIAADIMKRYELTTVKEVHLAIENNDILACIFARLLLWTDARQMPQNDTHSPDGWLIYYSCWRPGKPHPSKWNTNFQAGWNSLSNWADVKRT